MNETFTELYSVIPWPAAFDYSNYRHDEAALLQPLLEAAGYRNVSFHMGECDSFGPVTRIVRARTSQGARVAFIYG